jgi:hypothetical protein
MMVLAECDQTHEAQNQATPLLIKAACDLFGHISFVLNSRQLKVPTHELTVNSAPTNRILKYLHSTYHNLWGSATYRVPIHLVRKTHGR